ALRSLGKTLHRLDCAIEADDIMDKVRQDAIVAIAAVARDESSSGMTTFAPAMGVMIGSAIRDSAKRPKRVKSTRSCRWPVRTPGSRAAGRDRKSTRLNSSHVKISYAVFC